MRRALGSTLGLVFAFFQRVPIFRRRHKDTNIALHLLFLTVTDCATVYELLNMLEKQEDAVQDEGRSAETTTTSLSGEINTATRYAALLYRFADGY